MYFLKALVVDVRSLTRLYASLSPFCSSRVSLSRLTCNPRLHVCRTRDVIQTFVIAPAAMLVPATPARPDPYICPQVEPGLFRELHSFMTSATRGRGRVEVLSFAVTAEGASSQQFAAASIASSCSSATPGSASASAVVTQPAVTASSVGPAGGGVEAPGTTESVTAVASRLAATHLTKERGSREAGVRAAARVESADVVHARGSIAGLPDEHASRRERFAELDELQPGWEVELRRKGDTVEAVFFAPGSDVCVGAYAVARRQALAARKAGGAAP